MKYGSVQYFLTIIVICSFFLVGANGSDSLMKKNMNHTVSVSGVRIIKNIVIYKDTFFHSAFPSVIKIPDNGYALAFRRAPDRKIFMEKSTNHTDPNSYLEMLRSSDGESWSKEPELLYAHPFGGSQDPCLLRLHNGSILCASYGWALVRSEGNFNLKGSYTTTSGGFVFLGGYILRSTDNGMNWKLNYPPSVPSDVRLNALGNPLPAYNRGAMYEAKDGRIFWGVAVVEDATQLQKTSVYLFVSDDKGMNWKMSCRVAADDAVSFNETSMYETPKGDLLAFLRTAKFDDHACIARSKDRGKSFQPWEDMGFQGHPLHALRLPDNRVLLTYGYRHKPFGIRARILNPECTDYKTAPEIIVREDGGSTDLGYPWSVQLDGDRVLVVYYFNNENGTRFIAGTILEIK